MDRHEEVAEIVDEAVRLARRLCSDRQFKACAAAWLVGGHVNAEYMSLIQINMWTLAGGDDDMSPKRLPYRVADRAARAVYYWLKAAELPVEKRGDIEALAVKWASEAIRIGK